MQLCDNLPNKIPCFFPETSWGTKNKYMIERTQFLAEPIRIPVRVHRAMAELQRGGVGDGPDGGVRERSGAVPLQRAGGDHLYSRRPRTRFAARENSRGN